MAAHRADVRQQLALFSQQQTDRVGHARHFDFIPRAVELHVELGEILFGSFELSGGVRDFFGELLAAFRQGGVFAGQAADGRVGAGRFEPCLPNLLVGLGLPPMVRRLVPKLEFLFGHGDAPSGQIALQGEQFGRGFVGGKLLFVRLNLLH